ncbi:hypothetical protein RIF25_14510 [Thermosynechococcaceae cyanobacterium BACA0444]|uniref:Uncharacterized protein n=1 Tax=Pseudocalidococcus azoricus BACA0444 TaxID=2918990 RepID=A0AAE4FVV7_9CYAN|nr:hypothetical protein [Pseudocalidococcus azoricus]MDS3862011.1 hypothetical protein [Pseudocalidococcus azoricus BACA0444]
MAHFRHSAQMMLVDVVLDPNLAETYPFSTELRPIMPYLAITLDAESQARLHPLAIYPIVRGDHVTLAYLDSSDMAVDELNPAWLYGYGVGDRVNLRAVGWVANGRVQAVQVEIQASSPSGPGSSVRAWDGGVLHITLSRQPEVKSVESNALLAIRSVGSPLDLALSGTVTWQL